MSVYTRRTVYIDEGLNEAGKLAARTFTTFDDDPEFLYLPMGVAWMDNAPSVQDWLRHIERVDLIRPLPGEEFP